MIRNSLYLALLAFATPAVAEGPAVVTDILPVHSLVSQVMQGVAEPSLIVKPGTSPHGAALRPSQARALQNADLVVWIGEELTPWLEKPLSALAEGKQTVALLDLEGTKRLEFRDVHDHDEHDDHKSDEEGHAHEDHKETHDDAHDDEHSDHSSEHDSHAETGHDDHQHEGVDPHAWLDPDNAHVWLTEIAAQLANVDPENAEIYAANAKAGQERIAEVTARLTASLQPMQGVPFAAFHDAHQYFELRFGLTLAGTVTDSDDADPSPAQLAALRKELTDKGVSCAFAGPTSNTGLLEAAAENVDLAIYQLDPLGTELPQGPDLYPQLLWELGQGFARCIK